jgi:uncharacterized protein (DUF58 family)
MTARRARPGWFPRLTVRGGIFLGAGAALFLNAIVIDRRDLLFVGCLLLAVPIVALIYVTMRPVRLQVTRTFRPAIVPAGADTVVSLHVRNLSARPVYGRRWRDTASDGIRLPASALLPGLDRYEGGPDGGRDSAILEYTVRARHRGVYDIGPLILGRHDPFGLAFSERPVGAAHDLVVTPRVTALPGNAVTLIRGDGSMHEMLRHINPNSDELIAREYRPGDSLRRVNWPATARHGEIMVRQEEQRSNPDAVLILDTSLSGRPVSSAIRGAEGADRHDQAFELAVELAASVGIHLLDGAFRLQVVELGPSQLNPGLAQSRGGLHGDAPSAFRSPGGDRLLLEGLANVVPVDRLGRGDYPVQAPSSGAGAGSGNIPAFAVLVAPDEQDATALAALRGHFSPALALVLDTVSRKSREVLQDAGWQCVGVRSARDITPAWDQLQPERGDAHERA